MEFSLHRFSKLLLRDFLLHRKKVFLAIPFIILCLIIFTIIGHRLIDMNAGGGLQIIMISFFGLLVFGGGLLTSTNLGDLKTPAKRLQYLGLPASSFEKVLSKWLYTLVMFLGTALIIFYSSFYIYIAMFSSQFSESTLALVDHMATKMFPFFSILYIIGHSIAFFFSFVFNSFAAVKGGLLSVLSFLFFTLILAIFNWGGEMAFTTAWGNTIWKTMIVVQENLMHFLLIAPLFWLLSYIVFSRKTV